MLPMTFRLRLPTLFSVLRATSVATHAGYWGRCPHCDRTTPWHVNTLRGEYRCTACGGSTLAD